MQQVFKERLYSKTTELKLAAQSLTERTAWPECSLVIKGTLLCTPLHLAENSKNFISKPFIFFCPKRQSLLRNTNISQWHEWFCSHADLLRGYTVLFTVTACWLPTELCKLLICALCFEIKINTLIKLTEYDSTCTWKQCWTWDKFVCVLGQCEQFRRFVGRPVLRSLYVTRICCITDTIYAR
jgi:hypothetical protein